MIEQISTDGVLRTIRESLGIFTGSENLLDDATLAALLRRSGGILCPCAPSTLVASVLDGLQYLTEDGDAIKQRLTDLTDRLIISGDLLELNQVTTDDPAVKGTWVFAAPPSFVQRPDGSIFLLGVVPDEATPLPASLSNRVTNEGLLRVLRSEPLEDLQSVLGGLGWLKLSKTAWLKGPRPESAVEMREAMRRRLDDQPPSGLIADAFILDPSRDPHYYSSRWVPPAGHSGHFVARRPQEHGAPIWGFATVVNGSITKFLDLPLSGSRWRGCDVAWHLQMAIDDGLGLRQSYRCREVAGGAQLDFFSPLPLWAERRLAVLGHPAARDRCLFSYWIPQREIASEEEFLRERLWLAHQK